MSQRKALAMQTARAMRIRRRCRSRWAAASSTAMSSASTFTKSCLISTLAPACRLQQTCNGEGLLVKAQHKQDIPHRIHDELGVGTILCLQKDSDMAYFDLDIRPIQAACRDLGISHVRYEIRDFDPFDLQKRLPDAVRVCAEAAAANRGPLYIHCTAGLGRAPAVAMAWMHWCKGFSLDDAISHLTSIRACNPKVQAIRQATVDVLYPQPLVDVDIVLSAATVLAAQGATPAASPTVQVGVAHLMLCEQTTPTPTPNMKQV